MTTVTLLPEGRPLTAADLAAMPGDGRRHELVDGTLVVTPSPLVPHQRAVSRLFSQLDRSCPVELEVMFAPLDVTVSDLTVLQPDVLVAPRSALAGPRMTGLPVLAVEVLSASTRLIDLNLKKAAFEDAGVVSYWALDTDAVTITAWELVEGRYAEVAIAAGDEPFAVERPFPLTLRPADLVA